MELDEHLFRRESGRIVATLARIFGMHNLALAEDVAQDAFCRALEVWKFRGVPDNASAWLMATAKNRALDILRRERTALTYAPAFGRLLESEWTLTPVVEEQFGPNMIKDSELRMMFTCCHPKLPEEAQVALILNILCGFTAGEIASAFLSSKAAIEKRISRSKKLLAESKDLFEASDANSPARLSAVQRALYLLFNEGYHGGSNERTVRAELCKEAMRLTALLCEHPSAAIPATYALAALMCFDAARLPSRVDANGNLSSLFDQDRSRWDSQLIAEGQAFLDRSATGTKMTEYHLEAAIASAHSTASQPNGTDWGRIVELYDMLMTMRPWAIVELNRAVAIAQLDGPERGLEAICAIQDQERLKSYPFYFAALGELESQCGRHVTALGHFQEAARFARNPMEQRFYEQRINDLGSDPAG